VQTYLLADDATGRLFLRALGDAAERGVRVRLLLDDFYTQGLDGLLLGLAAHPNVEVRLFNPFAYGRDAAPARLWQLATDFQRLNHRMHNKLFVGRRCARPTVARMSSSPLSPMNCATHSRRSGTRSRF
jgi:cardiolipin synthase C